MADKVNLAEKLSSFSDHWAPRIVARYNDNEVRLVKVEGEFIWHQHPETDELFLILEGELDMEFRDRTVTLSPGELIVVPRGTAFGGAKGRTDVPKIVDWYMDGKIAIDPMITHTLTLDEINKGFDLMHAGESIRSVVVF